MSMIEMKSRVGLLVVIVRLLDFLTCMTLELEEYVRPEDQYKLLTLC